MKYSSTRRTVICRHKLQAYFQSPFEIEIEEWIL